jgi:TonB family protein
VKCPEPALTPEARAKHSQDFVALQVTITERGAVKQIAVMKGLDYELTQRAIEAVRRWRISPAIGSDGKPMALRIGILVTFGWPPGRGIATG